MSDDRLEYMGIRADPHAVSKLDGKRVLVAIPKVEIVAIDLTLGTDVQHPIVFLVFGAGLVLLGLLPFPRIAHWLTHGGDLHVGEPLMIVWLFIGAYGIYETIKKKWVLVIKTHSATRKMAFHGNVEHEELRQFLQTLESKFGYTIHSSL